VYFVSFRVTDWELGNRLLHIFGGGFLSFLICFFAVKDSELSISSFQFFSFSFLLVITLGVGNEILEFFLQNYAHFSFAQNVNDTWLDLISNAFGAIIAMACLTPFRRA
jgi:hypothetical protein